MATTTHRSESLRTRHVGGWRPRLVGAEDQEQGLRRALCNGGWGRVALSGDGRCLWSPLSRIPRRCRRLTEAGRSGGVKPDHTCWPAETLGVTPPARPAWLRPPTATRDPGQHPCGVNGVHFVTHTRRRPWEPEGSGPLPTGGVVPDPSSLSAGSANPPGRDGSLRSTTATRDPGQRRPQATTATRQRDPAPPPRCRAPAGGPALDLRRPPNAAASRPPQRVRSDSDRCAVLLTKTAGRQRNPTRSTELRHPRGHRTVRGAVKSS